MTNRDKINKMTNEEIAKIIHNEEIQQCEYCIYTPNACKGKSCVEGIKQWLESKAKSEADMMLEELGYKIDHIARDILKLEFIGYVNSKETRNGKEKGIKILKEDGKWLYSVFWYSNIETQTNDHDIAYITEEENKAIQKKIEELKEEK